MRTAATGRLTLLLGLLGVAGNGDAATTRPAVPDRPVVLAYTTGRVRLGDLVVRFAAVPFEVIGGPAGTGQGDLDLTVTAVEADGQPVSPVKSGSLSDAEPGIVESMPTDVGTIVYPIRLIWVSAADGRAACWAIDGGYHRAVGPAVDNQPFAFGEIGLLNDGRPGREQWTYFVPATAKRVRLHCALRYGGTARPVVVEAVL